jgi:hypothetical protein
VSECLIASLSRPRPTWKYTATSSSPTYEMEAADFSIVPTTMRSEGTFVGSG